MSISMYNMIQTNNKGFPKSDQFYNYKNGFLEKKFRLRKAIKIQNQYFAKMYLAYFVQHIFYGLKTTELSIFFNA